MSIPLPPLPTFDGDTSADIKDFNTRRITRAELRARDQEIVRCVLQAAAKAFETEVDTWDEMRKRGYSGAIRRKGATAIRALEFTHHE